jgi:tetratricopeptide (TPR) repeat protein
MQLNLLPSAQGLAAEPLADGLQVSYAGDLVSLARPGGLALSSPGAAMAARTPAHLAPAALPTLLNASWTLQQPGEFRERYAQLLEALANEQRAANGRPASVAHLELARFLVGQQLSYEAIGVLNDALRRNPQVGSNPEFRGLRGIANVMVRRYAEAQADFANPALSNDPGAAAWRGYIASRLGQWQDAGRQFDTGRAVFNQFPPLWRGRFAQAAATAALANGNNAAAQGWVNMAVTSGLPADEQAMTNLLQARLFNAQGDQTRALAMFNALMAARNDAIAAPATLYATQIRLARGQINAAQAAQTFDGLRFRWRGDGFELDVIRNLGQLYLSQGRYREALETFRSAGNRLPNLPQSAQLQADLSGAFRALFIDGLADGLQPVQALALFYDFRDLTPVGADGDLMVRRLVRRLVDVDLLAQAETLLAYQVNNRLQGVAQAQVANDLAVIYLMDRRPEDAINILNSTRTTLLPTALNLQRRITAARALAGLAQYDGALEMLGADQSAEASAIRAEITWRQRSWPAAGAGYERALGNRYSTTSTPLSLEEEGNLLRAAVAYSLAGDEASVTRLRTRWTTFVTGARNPDALRVALSGEQGGPVSAADFGRVAADNATFEGWVNRMKARFRQLASEPLSASSLRQAQGAPAAPAAAPAVTPAAARPGATRPRTAAPTRAAAAGPPRSRANG